MKRQFNKDRRTTSDRPNPFRGKTRGQDRPSKAEILVHVAMHCKDRHSTLEALEKLGRRKNVPALLHVALYAQDADVRAAASLQLDMATGRDTLLEGISGRLPNPNSQKEAIQHGRVPSNIKTLLESDDPKERMQGVDALSGNIFMLEGALENCPPHADVAEAVAGQLKAFPDALTNLVTRLWGKQGVSEGSELAYQAAVEALASMVDELDDYRAHAHIPLVSENALARSISVKKLKGVKGILEEIAMSSHFEDTRRQAKALMEETQV